MHSRSTPLDSTRLPKGNDQSCALVSNPPLIANHRVILTAVSAITPLLVLMNCLDQIQGAFVAVPMRPILALAQPVHSGPDYLGIHAKVLWAYAPPGHLAQPLRCQPMVAP
ncbi:hypothetical protein H6F75_08060 [Nodosilinea sp. FACHB-131]|uniref:hypothetical protein n=1 Tax=Cyanophyceae TaxID=3028117 RepID=UPI0016885CEF|nr:hypothetical protein [Nodosilinea sp. FACHB-131]MBD1873431.1 hypothetical protein [Nodosilinea sp. FACHB-131]